MVVPAVIQLNPKTYDDPLTFNPARWKVGHYIYIYIYGNFGELKHNI